ncbi:MAG TPA: hypothetical protein VFH43_14240 [Candidatus Kapabacteria bacterium]|nr:hypothetical protein [Candidatus Kapabacteria bacterium]
MANSSSNGSSSSSTGRSSGSSSTRRASGTRSSRSTSGRSGSPRGSSSSSRSTRGGSRSSNSGFSLGRSVVGPIRRSDWTPYVLGAIGLGVLIYGVSQISAVRSLVSPSTDFTGGYDSDFSSDMDDSIDFDEDVRVIGSDLNSVSRAM